MMNEHSAGKRTSTPFTTFPIGYHQLHPDVSINFQMNRFYNWVGDASMLDEMRKASTGVKEYPTFARIFLDLGDKYLAQGQMLKGAAYLRLAEFFIIANDERKQPTRQRFIQTVLEYYQVPESSHSRIPYESGWMSAYRFTSEQPKGTIVVFGGFDSYIEEWLLAAFTLRDTGYDVVLFEGPGQGTTLEDAQMKFTPEWDKVVKSVLDYYQFDDVTLMGFSMGGGLVLRAAALEKRVQRVIGYGIMTNMLEDTLRPFPEPVRARLQDWLNNSNADALNAFVQEARKKSLLLEWGIEQGMHTTGKQTPYDIFNAYKAYETASLSPLVTQDVLLLHGDKDHYISEHQFVDQVAWLTNVRSLTVRLFTEYEQAQNHCQVGNYGLALRTIIEWIESLQTRDQDLPACR
jgi:alpha-beta hydrolase superfamily lysophospholipase